MRIEKAIEKVVGVSLADMRDESRTIDRHFGRMLYTVYCGKKRSEIAKDLNKTFSAVWRYERRYRRYLEENEEFRGYDEEIKKLTDAVQS